MAPSLISVIIPAYNAEKYLQASIESVCEQTYRHIEVIVVDDGSEKACQPICTQFPGVRCLSQDHAGVAAAMNTGLANSRGSLIAIHDADDLCLPHKLSTQYRALADDAALGFVLSHLENFVEPGIEPPTWFEGESGLRHRMGFVSTALIRREVFREVGEFDPAYLIGEDIEWLLRARDAGVKHLLLPEVLTHRRIHDANLSADVKLGHANLLEILHASVTRSRQLKVHKE